MFKNLDIVEIILIVLFTIVCILFGYALIRFSHLATSASARAVEMNCQVLGHERNNYQVWFFKCENDEVKTVYIKD